MILLIDNYDSFSYNLYQLVGSIAAGIPFRLGTENVSICTGGGKRMDVENASSPASAPGECDLANVSQVAAETVAESSHKNEKTAQNGLHSGQPQEVKDEKTAKNGLRSGRPQEVKVIRNDELTVEEIENLKPDGIILSPGPGRPEDAGVCIEVVEKLGGKVPIFGVCLGHQSICKAYGATVSYAKHLMHGKQSMCDLDTDCQIFQGCSPRTMVGRYHSLAAVEETMPDCLQVIARTDDGEIMAVKHKEYNVYGLQFHPESILTPEGPRMLRNWVEML